MVKKFLIGFVFSIVLLVSSEYFLLEELYADRRLAVLVCTSLGLIISIVSFCYFYKTYRRLTK